MKKSAHVIILLIFFLLPFLLVNNFTQAQTQQYNNEPFILKESNNYIPSITFGHLLNGQMPQVKQIENVENNVLGAERIKDFLAQFEQSSQQSLKEFYETYPKLKSKSSTLIPYSSPTPYISTPTLLAGVNEIAENTTNNPSSSLGTSSQPTTYTGTLNENPVKNTYTIALLGDSMTDTLGKDLSHLRQQLQSIFPNYFFVLLNYGQGGTDLESGLYRLTNTTNYLNEVYPPLLSYKPDILVVESFAYNHWTGQKYDLDRQWLTIAKIIDTIKINSPETKIILAATIAPNAEIFGDGKLNWPKELKSNAAIITKAYLQNLINFATSEHYPLADAYHSSIGNDGQGQEIYINQGDHLHPSSEGARLFAQRIVEAIKENNLIR